MKTTTVRKLLPECWGFLCPVHTPDGSPCGLLNHITLSCVPVSSEIRQPEKLKLKKLLCRLGMQQIGSDFNLVFPHNYLPVLFDGILYGYVAPEIAGQFVKALRIVKCMTQEQREQDDYIASFPERAEVAFMAPYQKSVARTEEGEESPQKKEEGKEELVRNRAFPGVYISTTIARFSRPVTNLEAGGIEWIGPLEQLELSIACLEEDIRTDTTHQELDPINMMSIIASTVPFADYNQSPRNMYQCQMAK
jgi:DNA-directed RNA polymerase I subunit RPA2